MCVYVWVCVFFLPIKREKKTSTRLDLNDFCRAVLPAFLGNNVCFFLDLGPFFSWKRNLYFWLLKIGLQQLLATLPFVSLEPNKCSNLRENSNPTNKHKLAFVSKFSRVVARKVEKFAKTLYWSVCVCLVCGNKCHVLGRNFWWNFDKLFPHMWRQIWHKMWAQGGSFAKECRLMAR